MIQNPWAVCVCANPLIRCDLLTKSSVKILPESEIQAKISTQSPKSGSKKWMNSQSTAVAGSGNPLKCRFESEIQAKIFSKCADPFAYSPLSMRDHPGLELVCVCFLLSFPGTKFTITRDPPSTCTSWENNIEVWFPINSSHMCCVELALKGVTLALKGLWDTSFPCLLIWRLCHDNEPQ